MQCSIPARSLRAFGRAIHCAAKIGEEIYLEAEADKFFIRTVSQSKAAFACFTFPRSFFERYSARPIATHTTNAERLLRCKVLAKSCQHIFRTMHTIEKTVERCDIALDTDESRLVFQLFCKHGIVKTHHLKFCACDALQAVYSTEDYANRISCFGGVLQDVVVCFPTNLEEMSLVVTPSEALLKSYTEDLVDRTRSLIHTEMTVQFDEFESYSFANPVEVTFCLREFQAIIAFCESVGQSVNIVFDVAGRPIVFTIASDNFSAEFVLATLVDPLRSPSSSQSSSQQREPRPQATDPDADSMQDLKPSPSPQPSTSQSERSAVAQQIGNFSFKSSQQSSQTRPATSSSAHAFVSASSGSSASSAPTIKSEPMRAGAAMNPVAHGGDGGRDLAEEARILYGIKREKDDRYSDEEDEFVDSTPPRIASDSE